MGTATTTSVAPCLTVLAACAWCACVQVLVKPLDLEALRAGLLACIAQTQASPWQR